MDATYLTRQEAAEYLKSLGIPCKKTTLQKYATLGGGPEYTKFGKMVLYTRPSLNTWVDSKMSAPRLSTTKGGAPC